MTAWTNLATSMQYEPFAALKQATLGNTLSMTNNWGNDGRLASRRLYKTTGGANLSLLTYAYDKNGNRTSAQRRINTADVSPAENDNYALSTGTNRLASITTPSGTRSITPDARGNTLSETRPGGVTVSAGYDGYGRLMSYASSGTAAFAHVYNGLDDRVATTSTPSGGTADTRRFVTDPSGRVIGEYGTSATDVRAEFIWMAAAANDASTGSAQAGGGSFGGDDGLGSYMPLAVATTGGTLAWVHGNHMGVPITYTDATGTAIAAPSGYSIPGFPGQSQTLPDLYYNRYRDYDTTTGRYIQADPIGLAGGDNPYLYAEGNPVRYMDPSGKCPWCIIFGGAAIIGVWQWWTSSPAGPLYPYNPVKPNCPPPYTGGTKPEFDNGGSQPPPPLFMQWHTFNDPPYFNQKPPKDAEDPNGAKAPGKPGKDVGFEDPKSGPRWGRAPNGDYGWADKNGDIWVPTGPEGAPNSHGGPHWDVQGGRGGSRGNVYPSGHTRPH